VLMSGRIVESGGMEIAERLERDGYESFREPALAGSAENTK
jgi:Fe-S cluster assembly ATPase SufC